MIGLLGSPSPGVIERYQYMQEYSWPQPVAREDGKVCQTAEEYFCGPFFDNNGRIELSIIRRKFPYSSHIGRFLYEDLIPSRKLDDTVSSLEGAEKEAFLDLAKGMLDWHPDWRKTASELAKHPFLQPKQTSA